MKCVLLVYKDNYNVIEHYFKEGEDFLYFTDKEDLDQKIQTILMHYHHFVPLAESAYRKTVERYGLAQFVEKVASTVNISKE
jgi:spore maturation protein CgeB